MAPICNGRGDKSSAKLLQEETALDALAAIPAGINRGEQDVCVEARHINHVIKQTHGPAACLPTAGVGATSLQKNP